MSKRIGEQREESIAVAVDKDKGSHHALKWTIDNLLSRGQSLTLLHVRLKPASGLPSIGSNSDTSGDVLMKELFLPFRCFCSRKEITVDEIIVDDIDAAKGITEYVQDNAIETLVLGAPSRGNLLKKFKTTDVSSSVVKAAPNFCTVYVIARGKISQVRSATSAPPVKPPAIHKPLLQSQGSNMSDLNSSMLCWNPRAERVQQTPPMQDEMDIKSPFSRRGYVGMYESSVPESDISYVSCGRPSTDRMFPTLFENLETGGLSTSSDFEDNRSSYAGTTSFSSEKQSIDLGSSQYDFSSCSQDSGGLSWSTQSTDDFEVEMRRLKMELKQTMDMYSSACKEALTAKQKATELNRWKMGKEQKLEEARLAEEAALVLAEMEKTKCKAAIEAATAAQRIAELEAQKRKQAEIKAHKEAEEKNRALNALTRGDLRYRKYTIEEIKLATDHLSDSRKIGEGGYGPVYKCTLDHTPVAIKVLRADAAQGRSQFQKEVEVLTSMRHPNMVLLLGACPEFGCLVYEYMANGSLDDRLFRRGNSPVLPWQLRFRIAAEIATGLLFLHQTKPEPLVHRDLKPGNILLDSNFVSKIADVGLARLVPASVANSVTQYHMTATAGTFCYIDPEYQQTGMLGTKSDIYSLGIMLLQIITAKPPMGLTHHVEGAIENGTFAEVLDPAVRDWPVEEALTFAKLALQCAELRRKDRPDLGNVVLPELERLRALAEETVPFFTYGGSAGPSASNSQNNSQVSSFSLQEIMSDPQLLQSGYESSRSRTSTLSYGGENA